MWLDAPAALPGLVGGAVWNARWCQVASGPWGVSLGGRCPVRGLRGPAVAHTTAHSYNYCHRSTSLSRPGRASTRPGALNGGLTPPLAYRRPPLAVGVPLGGLWWAAVGRRGCPAATRASRTPQTQVRNLASGPMCGAWRGVLCSEVAWGARGVSLGGVGAVCGLRTLRKATVFLFSRMGGTPMRFSTVTQGT